MEVSPQGQNIKELVYVTQASQHSSLLCIASPTECYYRNLDQEMNIKPREFFFSNKILDFNFSLIYLLNKTF